MAEKLVLDAENGYSISKAAEDFMKNVLVAYDKMLEAEIEANVIVLNENKFSFLKKPGFVPTLFGMKVEYANLPESWDFYLQCRTERKTNADRIRSMTDEELAEELWAWNQTCCYKWKKEKILAWLKQECES